jgi:hypothetical protein
MSNNKYYHELINQEAADRYYRNMSEKTSNSFNKIEDGVFNTLDTIGDGVNNAYHKIGNTINNRKENFNSVFLADRLFDKENEINTLPTGEGDYPVSLYKGEPPYVQTIANKGDLFLAVTDVNGFREGDMIIINPKNQNTEMNFVIGVGNNLLRLKTALKNTHLPNEPVYNKTNEDISNNPVPFQKVGYGQILSKTRDIDFTPEEETWKFQVSGGNVESWRPF